MLKGNVFGNFSRLGPPELFAAAQVLNVIEIIGLIWLVSSFVVYGIRSGKWKKAGNSSEELKVNHRPIYFVSLSTLVFGLIGLVSDQVVLNIEHGVGQEAYCKIATIFGIICLLYFFLCYYLLLWLRLHYLYANISIIQDISPLLKIFKWLMLLLYLFSSFAIQFFYAYVHATEDSGTGCTDDGPVLVPRWPVYLLVSVMWVARATLIFQFLFPLRSHLRGRHAKEILRIAKRLAAITSCGLVFDLAVLLVIKLHRDEAAHLFILIFGIDVCLHVLFVVLSFENWTEVVALSNWVKRTRPRDSGPAQAATVEAVSTTNI